MKNKDVLILAIGEEAQDIVNVTYQDNSGLSYLALDNEKSVINTNNDKKIWFNNMKFQKNKYDLEDYKDILLNRASNFKNIISKFKNIIVVYYLGEKYSSDTLFEVIEYLKLLKLKYDIFAVKALTCDGAKAKENSLKSLEKLSSTGFLSSNNFFIFDGDEICKDIKSKGILSSHKIIDKKASEILKMIMEMRMQKE